MNVEGNASIAIPDILIREFNTDPQSKNSRKQESCKDLRRRLRETPNNTEIPITVNKERKASNAIPEITFPALLAEGTTSTCTTTPVQKGNTGNTAALS